MHVVGTVKGHPEMVWATFEHVNNAPNEAYPYTNNKNKNVMCRRARPGNWLFCKAKSAGRSTCRT